MVHTTAVSRLESLNSEGQIIAVISMVCQTVLSLLLAVLLTSEGFTQERFFFLDGYTATSRNNLASHRRDYLTQPARNGEPRVNLVSVGGEYEDNSIRARFVLQAGDSVNLNYLAEPGDSFKFIQESYLGFHLGQRTTLDVGTFFSHLGAESWLSRDNLVYTRSLVAEFSPYYETGARLSQEVNDNWSLQLLALNGWQSTTDARHPAFGTQLTFSKDNYSLSSSTFWGEENYHGRVFHDLVFKWINREALSVVGSLDVGHQEDAGNWWGYTLMGSYPVAQGVSLSARVERYSDPNGVIVTSVTGKRFQVNGASVGGNLELGHGMTLRAEWRELWSDNTVFRDGETATERDSLFVLSLSLFQEFS